MVVIWMISLKYNEPNCQRHRKWMFIQFIHCISWSAGPADWCLSSIPYFPSLLGVIINTPFDLDVYIQTKSQKPRKCIQPSPRKTTTFRMVIFHIFPLPWAPGHWMSLRQWQAWSASQRQGALRSAGDGDRGFTMQNAGISSFFFWGGEYKGYVYHLVTWSWFLQFAKWIFFEVKLGHCPITMILC